TYSTGKAAPLSRSDCVRIDGGLRVLTGFAIEGHDLFVHLAARVDGAVNARLRLFPIRKPRTDFDVQGRNARVRELDAQSVSRYDDREPLARIRMPGRRLAGTQTLTTNE